MWKSSRNPSIRTDALCSSCSVCPGQQEAGSTAVGPTVLYALTHGDNLVRF